MILQDKTDEEKEKEAETAQKLKVNGILVIEF